MEPTRESSSLPRGMVGTWTLGSYVSVGADGRSSHGFGPAPVGLAVFDAAGAFTMTVVRSDLPRFRWNRRDAGTDAENGAVVRGSLAYFGTYVLDGGRGDLALTIVGATLPNWIGTTQKRSAAMSSPDTLILTNASASAGGTAVITWLRNGSRPA